MYICICIMHTHIRTHAHCERLATDNKKYTHTRVRSRVLDAAANVVVDLACGSRLPLRRLDLLSQRHFTFAHCCILVFFVLFCFSVLVLFFCSSSRSQTELHNNRWDCWYIDDSVKNADKSSRCVEYTLLSEEYCPVGSAVKWVAILLNYSQCNC